MRLIPAHAGKTGDRFNLSGVGEAHPRSRGENASRDAHSSEPTGSSPLTRGKRERRRDPIAGARLIPAHAGKTVSCLRGCRPQRAHPRSRGENDPGGLRPRGIGGSSPLTRGKHEKSYPVPLVPWLIPAHAGKTGLAAAVDRLRAAHPRSRGENQSTRRPALLQRGSSPLTRGKPRLLQAGGLLRRLIPAHAGKTDSRRRTGRWCRAHPRSRGENTRTSGIAATV